MFELIFPVSLKVTQFITSNLLKNMSAEVKSEHVSYMFISFNWKRGEG